jgi:hypothetical protein
MRQRPPRIITYTDLTKFAYEYDNAAAKAALDRYHEFQQQGIAPEIETSGTHEFNVRDPYALPKWLIKGRNG